MAKKSAKKSKAKKRKRAKTGIKKPAPSRRKASARRKRPRTRVGSAFQIMIDTINETERMREKRELRGSDETE